MEEKYFLLESIITYMNIFIVDDCPIKSSEMLHDVHIISQIKESAQMLSTSHRMLDGTEYTEKVNNRNIRRWRLNDNREMSLYKATHYNHPCNIWVRESDSNYHWLYDHLIGLINEFHIRFNKRHKTEDLIPYLSTAPFNIKKDKQTDFVKAMPEKYITNEAVKSYRQYYIAEKLWPKNKSATWRKRKIPFWVDKDRLYKMYN